MSFGAIVSRGFAAAHKTPAAYFLLLLIFGVQQLVGAVSAAVQPQIQPGAPPGPEVFLAMAMGCFSCVWLFVILFGSPWVLGGVFGCVRDHIAKPGAPAGALGQYGGAFYTRMLLLQLIFVGLTIILVIPLVIAGIVVGVNQAATGADPQQFQMAISRNPLFAMGGAAIGLVMCAAAVVFNTAFAAAVVDDEKTVAALQRSIRFCGENFGDCFKLYLTYVALGMPMAVVQMMPTLLPVDKSISLGIGIVAAIYVPYLVLVNASLATSLYLARRDDGAIEQGPFSADAP